ncbi:N-acetyltransferase domain-containing protein [Mycena kentingensis (nom. inval.)]|nr:N-acetyltransferase domain-containing protein [Mycena kentingensis (nom. inval.)]
MPVTTSQPYAVTYRNAEELPESVWKALHADACASNIVLPIAQKQLARKDAFLRDQVYIAAFSLGAVDLILSATDGDNGKYPIFIYTPPHPQSRNATWLAPRLELLAHALYAAVSTRRVYSVFAPDIVASTFVRIWTRMTGIHPEPTPYYHAMISYCTRQSLVNPQRQLTLLPGFVLDIRPAAERDLDAVAQLCHEFAADSEPFVLTPARARAEAQGLIRQRQVWVHTMRRTDEPYEREEVACICAFTRNSESVAAITKVYTPKEWRRRGCAERLVRRVVKHLLATKASVALYVGHDNPARWVYHKVGFLGLAHDEASYEGVESWIEIGLDRSKVDLGHW